MKKILSLLIVLALLAACIPAAFASELVTSGIAKAGTDTKFTYAFTPDADGVLSVTVGDGTTNWSADVMYFDASFSIVSVATASGSGETTFTADLTAGITYRIRFWETSGGALTATPYSVTYETGAGGDVGSEDVGTVFESGSNVKLDCEDAQYEIYETISVDWTPDQDGILYINISGTPGWHYTIENVTAKVTGNAQTLHAYEVTGGTAYTIKIGCYDPSDYGDAAGTVTYALSFLAAEITVRLEDYTISEQPLTVGGNDVAMAENAYLTAFVFAPSETGTYMFTAPVGVELCWFGTPTFPNNVTTGTGETMTNTLTVEVSAVGQTLLIGVNNADLSLTSISITATKTGEIVIKEVELQTYVNKSINDSTAAFAAPAGADLGDYVDVYSETNHTAVLGTDGYYHLDSADGPILLVDMDYLAVLSDALNEGRGVMYAYVVDDEGNIVEKWDIGEAVKKYESLCDENGCYPMTEDLYFFYNVYAVSNGVPAYVLQEGYNEENAWMFACLTMTLAEEGSKDETIPETGDALAGVIAALVVSTMSLAVIPSVKKRC